MGSRLRARPLQPGLMGYLQVGGGGAEIKVILYKKTTQRKSGGDALTFL